MERLEIALPTTFWKGMNTRYPADSAIVNGDEFTAGSRNFITADNGSIMKRKDQTAYNSVALGAVPQDQFEAVFADGTRHFLVVANGTLKYSPGDGVFTTVTGSYSSSAHFEFANARGRVYFGNGVDAPQVYDKITPYGGVTYTVPKTRAMGVTPPAVGSFSGVQNAGGSIANGTYYYKATYRYHGGQESNGCAATASITVSAGPKKIDLSNIPVGGYGVEARKLYRSSDAITYYLVATIEDNTTTTYADTLASVDLTLPIPTSNGLPPTFSLIAYNLDRIWVASTATPYYLYWSEAGLPDVWSGSFISCNPNDLITGLAVIGQQVVVFNKGSMGVVQGSDSSQFKYVELAKVGCVDQRSIQHRTVSGLPTIVWLSPSGDVYSFNGSYLQKLSDAVQNQLLALQQTSQAKRQVTQSSQADFALGTSTPAITLSLVPGTITVNNPKRVWQLEADWNGASASSSAAWKNISNVLRAATRFAPTLASGSLGGKATISGTNVIIPSTDTGNESSGGGIFNNTGAPDQTTNLFAVPYTPASDGVVDSITFDATPSGNANFTGQVYTDSGGHPNAPVGSSGSGTFPGGGGSASCTPSCTLVGGTQYWIVLSMLSNAAGIRTWTVTQTGQARVGGVWVNLTKSSNQCTPVWAWHITYATRTGTWVSPVYDTAAPNGLAATLTVSGAYDASASSTVTVYGSADGSSFDVSQAISSPNGATTISLAARRYWKVGYALSVTSPNNNDNISVGTPVLVFATTATWESEELDHTTDITALNALTATTTVPAGTSVTLQIATTATSGSGYSAYGSIGSATARRFSKVKVTITTTGDNITSASLTGLTLTWTVVATQTSNIINLNTITGWDIFQAAHTLNGGTLAYYIRANAVSGNVTSEAWTLVANGSYPSITPAQYVQWKVQVTATADTVPSVDSVTINWLVSGSASLKLASCFYNQTYYLSGAEIGQTTNNVVFVLEQTGVWQVFYGWTASTMGVFFGDPFFGDATVGTMRKFNQGYSADYSFTVVTKAFSNELKRAEMAKCPRAVYLRILGTGATFTPTYSLDGGSTWKTLRNPETGLTSYVSPVDSIVHPVRFVPVSGENIFGRTIMIKVVNQDAFAAQINTIRLIADVSNREVLYG